MLPNQNNFSFCLHIFSFISFHSGRGECCHLALVATSYKMEYPKEKKFFFFDWKIESDFQRKGAKSCLPSSESLQAMQPQPRGAYMWSPAKAGLRNCHAPPYSSLYFSPQSRNTTLGPLSHSVTSGILCHRAQDLGTRGWPLTLVCKLRKKKRLPEQISICKEGLADGTIFEYPLICTAKQIIAWLRKSFSQERTHNLESHTRVCTLWMFWRTFG